MKPLGLFHFHGRSSKCCLCGAGVREGQNAPNGGLQFRAGVINTPEWNSHSRIAACSVQMRRHFNKQLKELWSQPPLKDKTTSAKAFRPLYEDLIEQVGPFRFAPLVSGRFSFTAHLNITFLRPGYPGQLFRTGGDIDNRRRSLMRSQSRP